VKGDIDAVSPDDILMLICGMTSDDVDLFASYDVITIRQLAQFQGLLAIVSSPITRSRFETFQNIAKQVVAYHSTFSPAPPATGAEPVYGYHYVSDAVFEQIKDDKILKSAYTLFQEYVNSPFNERAFHPWKRVYFAYLADAAKWNGARGKRKSDNLTDSDVFSFLVWRAVESFAKLDVTAGPRAVYFSWQMMPPDLHQTTIQTDQILGEDLRNNTIVDRYKRIIRINLTKLVERKKAVLYRVEFRGDGHLNNNNWIPTHLDQARAWSHAGGLWNHFEPGNSFFHSVPHGCVVTPEGTIPVDCLHFLDE